VESATGSVEALKLQIVDIKSAIGEAETSAEAMTKSIEKISQGLSQGLTMEIESEKAKADLELMNANVLAIDSSLKEAKTLSVETTKATNDALILRQRIDQMFPVEGLRREVIIEYKTKASPVRPFSEGMDAIEARMNSLPTGGSYTIGVGGLPSGASFAPVRPAATLGNGSLAAGAGAGAVGAPGVSVTIHVAGGPNAAKEIDGHLADLFSSNRSKLKTAMRVA
jgi:hypothetical protein